MTSTPTTASTQGALALVEEIRAAPTAEAIQAAIKETEVDYFGDYEFSEAQRNAVDVLVSAARALTPARETRDEALRTARAAINEAQRLALEQRRRAEKAEAHIDQVTRERDEAREDLRRCQRNHIVLEDQHRILQRDTALAANTAEAAITAQAADIARLKEDLSNERGARETAERGGDLFAQDVKRLKAELAGRDAEIARKDAALRKIGSLTTDSLARDRARAALQPTETPAMQSGVDGEWLSRASASIAHMVAEWYAGPARPARDIPVEVIDRRLRRFAPALTQSGAGEPVVKDLVWVEGWKPSADESWHTAQSVLGEYQVVAFKTIGANQRMVYLWRRHGADNPADSVEAAKAAAQADYERHILSALEISGRKLADANIKDPTDVR